MQDFLRPYQEQIAKRAAFLVSLAGFCYLAMECRTGKTRTALATAEKAGALSVLFVTKKKAIPSIQADFEAWGCRPFALSVINYESLNKLRLNFDTFDFVIFDEAHSLGAFPKPSKRQIEARAAAEGKRCLFLSGTPTPESYSQMYHQMQVLGASSPWAEFKNFYSWAKGGFVEVSQRMINGRPLNDYSKANEAKVLRDLSPYLITFTQEQAGFEASEVVEKDLEVSLADHTKRLFYELRKYRVAEINGHTVVADTPAALLNKLHQVSGGTIIADDGQRVIFDKSKALEIFERWGGSHVAIFYTYQAEGDLLRSIWGNASTDSPEVFQADPTKVFIGQVRASREGTRLDSAEALIFYSLEYSFLSYEQARQRASSKEREEVAKVYYLVGSPGIDAAILEAVRSKQDFTLAYYGASLKRAKESLTKCG